MKVNAKTPYRHSREGGNPSLVAATNPIATNERNSHFHCWLCRPQGCMSHSCEGRNPQLPDKRGWLFLRQPLRTERATVCPISFDMARGRVSEPSLPLCRVGLLLCFPIAYGKVGSRNRHREGKPDGPPRDQGSRTGPDRPTGRRGARCRQAHTQRPGAGISRAGYLPVRCAEAVGAWHPLRGRAGDNRTQGHVDGRQVRPDCWRVRRARLAHRSRPSFRRPRDPRRPRLRPPHADRLAAHRSHGPPGGRSARKSGRPRGAPRRPCRGVHRDRVPRRTSESGQNWSSWEASRSSSSSASWTTWTSP